MRYIYALVDPRNSQTRYVGVTKDIKERLKAHTKPGTKTATHDWCAELRSLGCKPIIIVLEETATLFSAERYWIAHFKALGADLLNRTTHRPKTPAHCLVMSQTRRNPTARA